MLAKKNLSEKWISEKRRKYAVLPLHLPAVAGRWLDGPLWVGEARLRGSGNRANLLFVGRVGGEKKKKLKVKGDFGYEASFNRLG